MPTHAASAASALIDDLATGFQTVGTDGCLLASYHGMLHRAPLAANCTSPCPPVATVNIPADPDEKAFSRCVTHSSRAYTSGPATSFLISLVDGRTRCNERRASDPRAPNGLPPTYACRAHDLLHALVTHTKGFSDLPKRASS